MAKNILILADHLRGQVSDITFEILGAGRVLADALGAQVHVAILGSGTERLGQGLGAADGVWLVEDERLAVPVPELVADALPVVMERAEASLVLLGGTNLSLGIGTVLSARTKLPFINFARALRVVDGAIEVTSQLLGGKMLADTRLADGGGIVSLQPGAGPADRGRSEKAPRFERVEVALKPAAVAFRAFLEPEVADVDITRQDVLVAVGRGIQSEDNVALAEELAQALGGAVCASRPVIDQGWLPMSRQVGKSGMTVKPRLYLALGISGAPEHWEGMQGSQLIVAINTDPKAPIFDGAHYGICGDALDYLPLLLDQVKARKGG